MIRGRSIRASAECAIDEAGARADNRHLGDFLDPSSVVDLEVGGDVSDVASVTERKNGNVGWGLAVRLRPASALRATARLRRDNFSTVRSRAKVGGVDGARTRGLRRDRPSGHTERPGHRGTDRLFRRLKSRACHQHYSAALASGGASAPGQRANSFKSQVRPRCSDAIVSVLLWLFRGSIRIRLTIFSSAPSDDAKYLKSGAVAAVRLNRFPSYAIPSGKNSCCSRCL